MKNESAMPKYKINWVRVYQDPNDELQKVGCSTPERPTRKYIEAHESAYKQISDVSVGLVSECLTVTFFGKRGSHFVDSCEGSSVEGNSGRSRSVHPRNHGSDGERLWGASTRTLYPQKELRVPRPMDWAKLPRSQRLQHY
jgi:hypothetical protein